MLLVGVAVKLGLLPSVVRRAPWQDVLDVAAYAALEAERYEAEAEALKRKAGPQAAGPRPVPAQGGTSTQTSVVKYVARKRG